MKKAIALAAMLGLSLVPMTGEVAHAGTVFWQPVEKQNSQRELDGKEVTALSDSAVVADDTLTRHKEVKVLNVEYELREKAKKLGGNFAGQVQFKAPAGTKLQDVVVSFVQSTEVKRRIEFKTSGNVTRKGKNDTFEIAELSEGTTPVAISFKGQSGEGAPVLVVNAKVGGKYAKVDGATDDLIMLGEGKPKAAPEGGAIAAGASISGMTSSGWRGQSQTASINFYRAGSSPLKDYFFYYRGARVRELFTAQGEYSIDVRNAKVTFTPAPDFYGQAERVTINGEDVDGRLYYCCYTPYVCSRSCPIPGSQPRSEPQPEPRPAPQSELGLQPEPGPPRESRPAPKPEPKPEPIPAPTPAPPPQSEPMPKPEPKPEPTPAPTPTPEPQPKPKPTPKPQPKPEPKPQPQPTPVQSGKTAPVETEKLKPQPQPTPVQSGKTAPVETEKLKPHPHQRHNREVYLARTGTAAASAGLLVLLMTVVGASVVVVKRRKNRGADNN
ncbi:MAG: hypothetical protein Q4A71_06445 [Actinomycetaceae bacterium]|nr:hypothetical protein [Actinomycetaceae bacterium]